MHVNRLSISYFLPFLALLICLLTIGYSTAATEIDRVYVVVNEDVVTQSEVERALQNAIYDLRSRGGSVPPLLELKSQVAKELVTKTVQYQQAMKLGIRVNDDEVIAAIKNIADRNNLSMRGLREEIEKTGRSYDQYRQELIHQLLIQKLIEQEVTRYIRISETDIHEYLKMAPDEYDEVEYKLAHVLVAKKESEISARSIANDVYDRIVDGAPFDLIAAELADSDLVAERSDLGWRSAGQLPELFLEFVRVLPVGGISPPIQSKNGFHILRLNGKRGKGNYVVEQKRVRQILLVETDIRDTDATLQQILHIYQRITAGEDFANIAKFQSSDPRSRALGGDIGWVGPGDLAPELERALALLTLGELSAPVQTKYGYHLIQITDQRNHEIGDQHQRAKARIEIKSEKFNQQYEVWKKELLSKAWIEYRLTY
jgi:peptidyl-prolyl cis-trans isomerase SurA